MAAESHGQTSLQVSIVDILNRTLVQGDVTPARNGPAHYFFLAHDHIIAHGFHKAFPGGKGTLGRRAVAASGQARGNQGFESFQDDAMYPLILIAGSQRKRRLSVAPA